MNTDVRTFAARADRWSFPSADGIHRLQVVEWLPDAAPRGIVQIVHGMADRMDRYGELARTLTARGYAVYGADLLGHGRTALGPGERGVFADRDGWAVSSRDVAALRAEGQRRYGGGSSPLPHVLVGHSMGSILVRQYLDDHRGDERIVGAALSGTTFMNPVMAGAGVAALRASMALRGRRGPRQVSPVVERLGGRVGRDFTPRRTSSDWLSRDRAFVDANIADPLCGFPASLSLTRDLMVGCYHVGGVAALRRIRVPLLLLSGSDDPLGGRPAVRRIVHELERAGHPDYTARVYPGARHEVFGETNRREVFADLGDWIDAHVG